MDKVERFSIGIDDISLLETGKKLLESSPLSLAFVCSDGSAIAAWRETVVLEVECLQHYKKSPLPIRL